MSSEKAHAGLPTASDYDPEAIGTAELEAGDPEQIWEEFGLELVPVLHDGEDTGRRFVRRNGKYVADVSERYKLLPNERAVAAANEVARDLGATPFHDFEGDWYVTLDDHVFQDEDRRRVHALYAWDDPVDIGEDDPVQFGFAVHNSIDGSMSFEVGLFTFRHGCANMVLMGARGRGMNFDSRDVVQHSTHAHTSGLEVDTDNLKSRIKTMLTFVDEVEETYRAWREQFLSRDEVLDLLDRLDKGQLTTDDLPAWLADIQETVEDAEENEQLGEEAPWENRAELVAAEMPEAANTWDTYNTMTEAIWHSATTNDRSKRQKMKDVHRVLQPAEGIY